jgi:protein-ribulosamine 3-kinase
MIPMPIGVIPLAKGPLFVMEALNAIERDQRQWRQIGRTLARIHRIKSDHCGFHMNNYFGPLGQDNTQVRDWPTFYGEYRLRPRLRMAVDSGHLPSSLATQVEIIIERMPELCGPEVTPTLLHGDAQQSNFVSTLEGAYVIDPAIHYGNPELDLAYVDYFQPVPKDVLDAYQEEMPIDPGFAKRRSLWRISGYLAAVAVEGSYYTGMLTDAVQRYL